MPTSKTPKKRFLSHCNEKYLISYISEYKNAPFLNILIQEAISKNRILIPVVLEKF